MTQQNNNARQEEEYDEGTAYSNNRVENRRTLMDLLCGENDDGFSQSDISERPMPSFINFKQGHRQDKAQLFEADLEAVDDNDMDLSQDVKTQDAFEPMRSASHSFHVTDDSVLQQSKVKLSMATP